MTERRALTHASAPAPAPSDGERYYAESLAAFVAELARNWRLMELARHNGFEIDVREYSTGSGMEGTWWYVPLEFQRVTGFMAGRVQ